MLMPWRDQPANGVGRFANGTFSEDHRPNSGSPLVLNGRGMHSAERLCGSGDDLVVWHVAYVLSDVPAMPEGVLELAVSVAPEHVRQRLMNLCTRHHRLGEHGLDVGDVEGQHHRRTANRGRGEHPHLRELVGDVQQTVANPSQGRLATGVPAQAPSAKEDAHNSNKRGAALQTSSTEKLHDDRWLYIVGI